MKKNIFYTFLIALTSSVALTDCIGSDKGLLDKPITPEPPEAPLITGLDIEGIPAFGGVMTAKVICDLCVADKYKYQWFVDGTLVSSSESYILEADKTTVNIELEATGENASSQQVVERVSYLATSPAKYIAITFDYKNTGILLNDGTFNTYGLTGGIANKTINDVKTVISSSYDMYYINQNDLLKGIGPTGISVDIPNVSHALSNGYGVAAVLKSGGLAASGHYEYVMPPASYAAELYGIKKFIKSVWGFGIINGNGDAYTWGNDTYQQAATPLTNPDLAGLRDIFSEGHEWYGIKNDGKTVVKWGVDFSSYYDIKLADVQDQFTDVLTLKFTTTGGAALNRDGSVVTWGPHLEGGDSSALAAELSSGVVQIISFDKAVIARKATGELYAWGDFTGKTPPPANMLNVTKIVRNGNSVAALTSDGAVITFGGLSGGDSSTVSGLNSGVKDIYSGSNGFAALKNDNSVVTWGSWDIADAPVQDQLTDIKAISVRWNLFVAFKADGTAVTWGNNRMQAVNEVTASMNYEFTKL